MAKINDTCKILEATRETVLFIDGNWGRMVKEAILRRWAMAEFRAMSQQGEGQRERVLGKGKSSWGRKELALSQELWRVGLLSAFLTCSSDALVGQLQETLLFEYETWANKNAGADGQCQACIETVFVFCIYWDAEVGYSGIQVRVEHGIRQQLWHICDLTWSLGRVRADQRQHVTWQKERGDVKNSSVLCKRLFLSTIYVNTFVL